MSWLQVIFIVPGGVFLKLCLFRILFGVLSSQCRIFVSSVSFNFPLMRFGLWVCSFTVFQAIWRCWFRTPAFWVVPLNFELELHKVLWHLIGCFLGFAFGSGGISKNRPWWFQLTLPFRSQGCSFLREGLRFRQEACSVTAHDWRFWFLFPSKGSLATLQMSWKNLHFVF